MKYPLLIYCIIACSLMLSAQDLPPFSSMDVFALEWADHPQISPDGKQIVYQRRGMDIMKDRRTSQLWIMDSDGSNHEKLVALSADQYNAQWSPDGSKLVFTASTEEGTEVFMYWLESKRYAKISQLEHSPSNLTWSPDGEWIAFTMFVGGSELALVSAPKKPKGAQWAETPRVTTRLKHERDGSGYMEPGYTQLFVLSADGGTARQISTGSYRHSGPLSWAADGKAIFFSGNRSADWEYDFRNSEVYRIDIATSEVTTLTDRVGPDNDPAVSPDGKLLAYTGYDDQVQAYQISRLYLMDLGTQKVQQVDLGLDRDIRNIQWQSDSKGLYFLYDDKGNTKVAKTTIAGEVTMLAADVGGTGVARPYGGGDYSVSRRGDIVYTYTTPYHPSEVGLVRKGKTTAKLTALNDDILPYRKLGQVEEIWYNSSFDDRPIQGWLVYPPDFKKDTLYPLLVENHGGPIANYGDRFSPEMQLYASAGYVVFYPNPRGSTSYGEEFGNLLYNNYPGEDYNDVMDGVDAVIAKGYVDTDQLYVTGGSAGGIMTAWMIGKSDRFRSAAVVKPVMNWISKTLVADNYFYYANSRYPGQPWENMETYWKFSPVSLVGNISTPTLVMVGSEDLRTPLSEAKQLYHALKIRKVETALVEVPGAYHFIANRPSQMITKIEHILAWFERTRTTGE